MHVKPVHVIITVVSILVVCFIGGLIWRYNGSSTTHAETNFLEVSEKSWTEIKTDPLKEKVSFNPTSETVHWLAVINKDFRHPTPLVGEARTFHFGNGVKYIDVKLAQTEPAPAQFIVKREPK